MVNFSCRGAVKAGAKGREQAEDIRVRVALDGIVRMYVREAPLPSLVLKVHLAQVRHKKCCFGVRLVDHGKAGSPHDAVPKVDIRMAIAERREIGKDRLVFGRTSIRSRLANDDAGVRGVREIFVYRLGPRMI